MNGVEITYTDTDGNSQRFSSESATSAIAKISAISGYGSSEGDRLREALESARKRSAKSQTRARDFAASSTVPSDQIAPYRSRAGNGEAYIDAITDISFESGDGPLKIKVKKTRIYTNKLGNSTENITSVGVPASVHAGGYDNNNFGDGVWMDVYVLGIKSEHKK